MQVKQFVNNPFQENTYVAFCPVTLEAVIIDCGASTEREREAMQYYIDRAGLKVKHLLNTHLHLDHCIGNHWAETAYSLTAEASELDRELYDHLTDQARQFGLPESMVTSVADRKLLNLNDGDIVCFGRETLRVILTPGHTPGGLCLYNEADAVLFSGDTLFNSSVGRTDLPGGSMSALIRSIRQRLISLPDNVTVYTGHGPSTTIADEKRYNPFI